MSSVDKYLTVDHVLQVRRKKGNMEERQRIANYLTAIFDISDSAAWAHAGQLLPIPPPVTAWQLEKLTPGDIADVPDFWNDYWRRRAEEGFFDDV